MVRLCIKQNNKTINKMKRIALIIALTIISTFTFAQNKYSLTVTVKGINERSGKIYASLSNDANNFPQSGGFATAIAEVGKDGDVVIKFENVLEGRYAIVLFQDLNGNKTLDMNGMMPTEPFGFSNVTMLMGPPTFEQCAFELNENKSIEISLMAM